jgi:hypothetical protein
MDVPFWSGAVPKKSGLGVSTSVVKISKTVYWWWVQSSSSYFGPPHFAADTNSMVRRLRTNNMTSSSFIFALACVCVCVCDRMKTNKQLPTDLCTFLFSC